MSRTLLAVVSAALVACSERAPDLGQIEEEVRRASTLHARGGGFTSVAGRGRHLWFGDRFGWLGFVELPNRVHLTGGFVGKPIQGIDVRDDQGNSGTGRNLVFLTTRGEQGERAHRIAASTDRMRLLGHRARSVRPRSQLPLLRQRSRNLPLRVLLQRGAERDR